MTERDWHAFIQTLLGRPFRLGARGPDAYDCWGVVEAMFAARGYPSPGNWWIDAQTPAAHYSARMEREIAHGPWQRVAVAEPGDVLALSTHRRIHHVAAVTPFGALHADRPLGIVLVSRARLRALGYRRCEEYRWAP